MKKYFIGFGVIVLLHLLPYLMLNDANMVANIETAILIPDVLILGLVFTSENKK